MGLNLCITSFRFYRSDPKWESNFYYFLFQIYHRNLNVSSVPKFFIQHLREQVFFWRSDGNCSRVIRSDTESNLFDSHIANRPWSETKTNINLVLTNQPFKKRKKTSYQLLNEVSLELFRTFEKRHYELPLVYLPKPTPLLRERRTSRCSPKTMSSH